MAYDYITKYNFPGHTAGKHVAAVFGQGPRSIEVDIIHWWGLPSWGQTLHGVCSFFEGQLSNGTGAHYVVTAGTVACGIAEADASHANGHSWANAHSVTWECNPNARDGDYDTLAEALADTWIARGYTKPGLIAGHNDYTATQCPGDYALARVRREAAAWFHAKRSGTVKPAEASAPKPIKEPDLLEEAMSLDRNSHEYRNFVSDIAKAVLNEEIGYGKDKQQTGSYVLRTDRNVAQIERLVRDLPQAILTHPVELEGDHSGKTDAATKIAWQAHELQAIRQAIEALTAALTGQEQADSTDPAPVEQP